MTWSSWNSPPPAPTGRPDRSPAPSVAISTSLSGTHRSPSLPRTPPELVDVDGDDQHGADRHLLPERLDPEDHEAVVQHGRDQHADDRAEHGPHAAEQARPAQPDRGDRLEVVGRVAAHRG